MERDIQYVLQWVVPEERPKPQNILEHTEKRHSHCCCSTCNLTLQRSAQVGLRECKQISTYHHQQERKNYSPTESKQFSQDLQDVGTIGIFEQGIPSKLH
jgi:hypothetical protein